jgi:cytochrome c biogenesis protein CcmG, thiol:disulfide interchange protein DsbE
LTISGRRRSRQPDRRALSTLVLTVTVVVGVVFALGLRRSTETAVIGSPAEVSGTVAPPLAGRTLDGGYFDLTTVRGHVLLVNVFASWCGPCRDELPLLVDAKRHWSAQGLRLVGLDVRDGTQAVRALLRETGAEALTVLPDPDGTRAVAWGVRGVPETFVVDRDGRIVHRQQGAITRQWLEQWVAPLLAR